MSEKKRELKEICQLANISKPKAPKLFGNRGGRRKIKLRSSAGYSPKSDADESSDINTGRGSFENDRNELPNLAVKNNNVKHAFTVDEDQLIIKYLSTHHLLNATKGNSTWEEMAETGIFNNRSWQSLKNRFLRYILPNIQNQKDLFDIDENVSKILHEQFESTVEKGSRSSYSEAEDNGMPLHCELLIHTYLLSNSSLIFSNRRFRSLKI